MARIEGECRHCGHVIGPPPPGQVRQWRLFAMPAPLESFWACSAICEGAVRRECYALLAQTAPVQPSYDVRTDTHQALEGYVLPPDDDE